MAKSILIDVFENETDFKVCVFDCCSAYVVTIYDEVSEKHKKMRTLADHESAKKYAKELNAQYVEF